MVKIGTTGSIASGKTTVSKLISKGRGPLFNADRIVQKLYKKRSFKKLIAKKLKFKFNLKFKKELKVSILKNHNKLKKIEEIIHPLVRKEMLKFLRNNKDKNFLFLEIPLLVENKLTSYFDRIIFIKSNKNLRLKRYKLSGGNHKMFNLLDSKQIKDTKKMKICDHVIVNNKTISILKKKLSIILSSHE